MAGENKQIYQLTTGEFTGESLVPFEVPNPDPTTVDEKPKVTRKGSGDAIAEFVAKTQEFQTDLNTDSKTLVGAINEVSSSVSVLKTSLNQTITHTNGTSFFFKRRGSIISVEVATNSTKSFSTSWVELGTLNSGMFSSDIAVLYVPIQLVNNNQLMLRISGGTGKVEVISNVSSALYPQGLGIYFYS